MTDKINSPSHYTTGNIEVIEIIEQLTEGMEGKKAFNLGNVIKYIFRHENKGGRSDLKKAAWYLNRVIDTAVDPEEENQPLMIKCKVCSRMFYEGFKGQRACGNCLEGKTNES